jgi:hypothetical protein
MIRKDFRSHRVSRKADGGDWYRVCQRKGPKVQRPMAPLGTARLGAAPLLDLLYLIRPRPTGIELKATEPISISPSAVPAEKEIVWLPT